MLAFEKHKTQRANKAFHTDIKDFFRLKTGQKLNHTGPETAAAGGGVQHVALLATSQWEITKGPKFQTVGE